jgi:hypothetical protein
VFDEEKYGGFGGDEISVLLVNSGIIRANTMLQSRKMSSMLLAQLGRFATKQV